jgi:hypothetical protein
MKQIDPHRSGMLVTADRIGPASPASRMVAGWITIRGATHE